MQTTGRIISARYFYFCCHLPFYPTRPYDARRRGAGEQLSATLNTPGTMLAMACLVKHSMKFPVLPLVFLCLFAFNLYEHYCAQQAPATPRPPVAASDLDVSRGDVPYALDNLPSTSARIKRAWGENTLLGSLLLVFTSVVLVPWFLALCVYMLFNLATLKVFKPRALWPKSPRAAERTKTQSPKTRPKAELADLGP